MSCHPSTKQNTESSHTFFMRNSCFEKLHNGMFRRKKINIIPNHKEISIQNAECKYEFNIIKTMRHDRIINTITLIWGLNF